MSIATKIARLCMFIIAIIALAGMAQAQKIPKSKPPKAEVKKEELAVSASPQTPEQVDAFMGSLSDEEARKELRFVLKRQTASKVKLSDDQAFFWKRDSPLAGFFFWLKDEASAISKKLSGHFSLDQDEADDLREAWQKLTGGKGIGRLMLTILSLSGILLSGFCLRKLFSRATREIHVQLMNSVNLGRLEFLGRVLANLILDALGVAIFVAATFLLFVLFYTEGDIGYELVWIYLIVSYYLALYSLIARFIFAPDAPSLRLFPMENGQAAFFYRWMLYIISGAWVITGASGVFDALGAGGQLQILLYSLGGAYVTVALIFLIWMTRKQVADIILPKAVELSSGSARQLLARYWHYVATLYVLGMGIFWVFDVLLGGDARIIKLLSSLFVLPIFIGLDQWGYRLLKVASGELTQVVDLSGDQIVQVPPPGKSSALKNYAPIIRRLCRIVLAGLLFFVVLNLWGVDVALAGRMFTSHVLSIVISMVLGFIAWELIKARIDNRLREEMPTTEEDHDEGGGVGSRTGTLLLLLRKFILTVLLVIISLIVLSSIGVNIGPLIAGAGVIGLAIGFGAQTLVRDIIAGVFFLIDDAFRIGDYVESAGVKGMVEQISLRSIKLRHPRGMVYTIPFGNLRSITNFSRDYTITKLDIRVGFETDLEQVRKVIKKINKTLRKDEDINKIMLDDLKSQGVKEFDDSSMIVRVKFKTLPGEQFKVRKEVYRMIQSEFRAAGIDFASRNVTVEMRGTNPEDKGKQGSTGSDSQAIQAGAGAALALIQQEEEKQKAALAAKPKKE